MSRFRRILGSSLIGTLAILLLAGSAVTGNVFQGVGRADLKSQLRDANTKIASLEAQQEKSQGETECRSRIAGASETQSGRILLALADLVLAAQNRDDELGDVATAAIGTARQILGPLLDDREESVEICKANPEYRPTPSVGSSGPTTTTTTTGRSIGTPKRLTGRTTTTRTTTPSTSSSTTRPSSTTTPRPCLIPIIVDGLPCL